MLKTLVFFFELILVLVSFVVVFTYFMELFSVQPNIPFTDYAAHTFVIVSVWGLMILSLLLRAFFKAFATATKAALYTIMVMLVSLGLIGGTLLVTKAQIISKVKDVFHF